MSEALFWSKVDKTGDCWLWTGPRNTKGYGRVQTGARRIMAHRVAYEIAVGPIPDAMTIDHLCRNRACVNPSHLEAVTNRENILRGTGPSAVNAAKTTCSKGHALVDGNVRVSALGKRSCRKCSIVWLREDRRRRSAARLEARR